MEVGMTLLRTAGLFLIGLAAFRLMGSQSVGRLTDFDLVVVIAIGAIIGDGLADPELNFWLLAAAIAGLVALQIAASLLSMKFPMMEKLVMGSPIKLIDKGRILINGLRKARITRSNLMQELRVKGLNGPENVEQAYMEPNGKLSVVEKEAAG
jgi:Predicted membrane protein